MYNYYDISAPCMQTCDYSPSAATETPFMRHTEGYIQMKTWKTFLLKNKTKSRVTGRHTRIGTRTLLSMDHVYYPKKSLLNITGFTKELTH